ncbi:MAG: class I SAM-dependent methyltransferase [Beijerinckiaceae bacterium]
MSAILDKPAFIRTHTRVLPVPHAPEIKLHVADELTPLWQQTEEDLGRIGLPPPFWAFAWAGGQALARYILDHPALVRGKRVFDFASGSGLVAIAAMKAGAASATASEIDPFALEAITINAALNGVAVSVRSGDVLDQAIDTDVICAGDVFYQRDMATRVAAWLKPMADEGRTVLVGDPGRSYLARDLLVELAEYRVPVTRDLEDAEIKRSCVYRFRKPGEAGS